MYTHLYTCTQLNMLHWKKHIVYKKIFYFAYFYIQLNFDIYSSTLYINASNHRQKNNKDCKSSMMWWTLQMFDCQSNLSFSCSVVRLCMNSRMGNKMLPRKKNVQQTFTEWSLSSTAVHIFRLSQFNYFWRELLPFFQFYFFFFLCTTSPTFSMQFSPNFHRMIIIKCLTPYTWAFAIQLFLAELLPFV